MMEYMSIAGELNDHSRTVGVHYACDMEMGMSACYNILMVL